MLLMSLPLLFITFSILGASAQTTSCLSAIDWQPCPNAAQAECASYQVPLDYAHPEVGNATLAVARIKSSNQPRLGTLFFNPGGPGNSGVGFLLGETGGQIANVTNGQYDIVSWDPRGVNQTKPLISCGFPNGQGLVQFWNGSVAGPVVEARGNFTDQDDLDVFFEGINATDAKIQQFGQKCVDSDGAFLKYMGSAAVVRDMVSLSDCLGGAGKPINYYGISYGTVLGNLFVNMFPERVGRVIIDGVVDSIAAATGPTFKTWPAIVEDAEQAFSGFMQQCAQAGPQGCALAKSNSTAASLAEDIRTLINTTYDLHKAGQPVPSADQLRFDLYELLNSPSSWAAGATQINTLAETLANATAGKATAKSKRLLHKSRQNANASDAPVDPIAQAFNEQFTSPDQDDVTTDEALAGLVSVTREDSPMFGELMSHVGLYCHRFPVRAVERFTGPFNNTLANPIIVIGNQADPKTPFMNAQRIADELGSSARLLKQNGIGHTSTAEPSTCTLGAIRNYFLQGTLPNIGQVCEVDNNNPFPKKSNVTNPNPDNSARRALGSVVWLVFIGLAGQFAGHYQQTDFIL